MSDPGIASLDAIEQRFRRLCRTVDMSPSWSGGILGNLGQFIDVRPAVQFPPDAPWNSSSGAAGADLGSMAGGPSVDPEALKFAAAWRRMYLTPRPPVLGRANTCLNPTARDTANRQTALRNQNSSLRTRTTGIGLEPELNGRHELSRDRCRTPIWATEQWSIATRWLAKCKCTCVLDASAAAVPASYQAAQGHGGPLFTSRHIRSLEGACLKRPAGLYKFFHDAGSYPSGGNRNGPGCKEEWKAAREKCEEMVVNAKSPRRLTGDMANTEDCARGHVSERCGGKPIDWLVTFVVFRRV